jgi:hypothetical protein
VWAFAPPLVIDTAARHRVFDVLAKRKSTLGELTQATGASSRGLAATVGVLIGLGLLDRDEAERYALTPESEAFLVSGQPDFLGGIFHHMGAQVAPNWLRLAEIVGNGKPAGSVGLAAERANRVWSYDFVEDRTHEGRKYRTLNIIDEFTHECLAIRTDRRFKSFDVIDVLSDLFILRGVPEYIRSDNGPEFIAEAAQV